MNVLGLRRTCFATVLLGRNLAVTDDEPVVRPGLPQIDKG